MTETGALPQTPAVDGAAITEPLPLPPPTDAAHVRAAASFTALYQEHFGYVWRSLRRLGIPDADLPDLAHDVFVVVHRKLGDYDPARPAKPWLFGICFRVALDKKRKASSFRESLVEGAGDRVPARDRPADDVVEAREAHEEVMRALDGLDLDKRAVFVLHELEGLSMPEIARVVDAPLNTLYSRLRLAREAFVAAVRRAPGRRSSTT